MGYVRPRLLRSASIDGACSSIGDRLSQKALQFLAPLLNAVSLIWHCGRSSGATRRLPAQIEDQFLPFNEAVLRNARALSDNHAVVTARLRGHKATLVTSDTHANAIT